jgi:GNAT superfamily N-acetyltransferase
MSSMDEEARLAYLPTYFRSIIDQGVRNDAIIQEANNWSCCSVWLPPGRDIGNIWTISPVKFFKMFWYVGFGGCKRMLWDYQVQSDVCKAKGLQNAAGNAYKEYHYLFITGTVPEHQGQGLASGMITQYQDKARKDGLPIWLEATTAKSRDLYDRLGFETVGEIVLGKGTHAETGFKAPNGPGVTLWGMIWRPPADKSHARDEAAARSSLAT